MSLSRICMAVLVFVLAFLATLYGHANCVTPITGRPRCNLLHKAVQEGFITKQRVILLVGGLGEVEDSICVASSSA